MCIRIQGRVNFKIVQLYSIDALKLARNYKCKKFLINHSKTLLGTVKYKIHTDGDALEKFGFNVSNKIAIVISSGKNDSHFFEKSDSNVKWSNFKYFNTFEKAIHLLEKDE